MPNINRYETALEIISSTAIECGLGAVNNVAVNTDPAIKQLQRLLTNSGRWMALKYQWPQLLRDHTITTAGGDTGKYPLPDDFGHMIDQTGWELTQSYPLNGPLSSQDWKVLQANNADPVYLSFRFREGEFWIFPQPPPVGLQFTFEYISRGWVQDAVNSAVRKDNIVNDADVVMFEPMVMTQFLRKRFLAARGFSTQSAEQDFQEVMDLWSGKNVGAPVLSMVNGRGFPLIDIANAPDTGYGL